MAHQGAQQATSALTTPVVFPSREAPSRMSGLRVLPSAGNRGRLLAKKFPLWTKRHAHHRYPPARCTPARRLMARMPACSSTPTVANTRRKAATKRTTTVHTLHGSHSDQWRATRAMRRRPCLRRTAVVAPVRRCNAPARKYLPNRRHRIRRPDRTLRPAWVASGTHLPRRWRRTDTASFANTRPLVFPAACMLH